MVVLIVMVMVTLTLLLSSFHLPAILGSSYSGMELLLIVMAPAPVFIGLGAVYGQMGLLALGNTVTRLKFRDSYFIVGVCSLLFVIVLTPFLYEYGAALTLLFSEILVFVLMYYHTKRSNVLRNPY